MAAFRHREEPTSAPTAGLATENVAPEKARRRAPRRRLSRWITIPVGVVVSLGVTYGGLSSFSAHALAREEERSRRLGLALTMEEFLGPPIPAAQDAKPEAEALDRLLAKIKDAPYGTIPDARLDEIRELSARIAAKGRISPTVRGATPDLVLYPHYATLKSASRHLWEGAVRKARRNDVEAAARDVELCHALSEVAQNDRNELGAMTAIAIKSVARAAIKDALRENASPEMLRRLEEVVRATPSTPVVVTVRNMESWMFALTTSSNSGVRNLLDHPASDLVESRNGSLDEPWDVRVVRFALTLPGTDVVRWRIRERCLKAMNDEAEAGVLVPDANERHRTLQDLAKRAVRESWISRKFLGPNLFHDLRGTEAISVPRRAALSVYLWALERRAATGELPKSGPKMYRRDPDGKGFRIVYNQFNGREVIETWPTSTRRIGPNDPVKTPR